VTSRTGIATRLKLIVPLHIPCTAISFLLKTKFKDISRKAAKDAKEILKP
jgi:hypothetical protein